MKHIKLFEQFIDESRMDSEYLQRMLNALAKDYKKQGEKDLYKFYDYLETRLNQSYPSGDVDRDDIEDIMRDSRFRSMKLDIPEWAIDDLFEQFVNEGKSFRDLEMAVKYHEEGNPTYDRTKVINIYNQLSNKDQQKAKKSFPKVFGKLINEKLDAKDLSQKIMKELDSFGQLHTQYQSKEVLDTIKEVLSKYKSLYGGRLTQKVATEIRAALGETGNLANDSYRHIKDVDYIIVNALQESIEFVNEAKATKKDFDKVVKVLKKSKYPITVMYVKKWDEIDIIVGYNAPDKIADDVMDRLEDAGLYSNSVSVSGDSSNYSRREYDAIEKINGGHRSY